MSESVMPKGYRPRIVDEQIERYLRLFGAIEVSGTKWCGKTWSSLAHASSVTYVDRGANLVLSQADPGFPLIGEPPHVIDEWQRVPGIWDAVRHAVDESGGIRGSWILTGSSTPRVGETAHSGAGRIGRIRMHPMTLQESGDSTGEVSLASLFDGDFRPVQCPSGVLELAELICRGGWPEVIGFSPDDSLVIVREYLESVFVHSVPQLGGEERVSRRLVQSLSRNIGQSVTNATLALDVFGGNSRSDVTEGQSRDVSLHLDLLTRIFLVDEVPGWVPASRSPRRMRVKPKRYFADPSVVVSTLGLSASKLLQDWQTLGLAFENLCMRDLDVYACALAGAGGRPLGYYRDDSGLEADAIVELADGRWGAFEMKLSEQKVDTAAESLLRMRAKLLKDPLGRTPEPAFLAVLLGVGSTAYQRPDGVYVIPIRALGR